MNKIVKLSLAAAVAVTATTSASAKSLVEAIQDVDVSGSVVYRYDDYNADDKENGKNGRKNKYKAVLNVKSKINDDVNLNTTIMAGNAENTDMSSSNPGNQGDENLDVEVSKLNFDYTGIKNTTVTLGKQGLKTPWTMAVDNDGAEQTGSGIMAQTTWSGVTFVGAYFNQTNFDDAADGSKKFETDGDRDYNKYYGGEEDFIVAGLMTNIGPVVVDAWYSKLDDNNTDDGTAAGDTTINLDTSFDAYTVGADYAVSISDLNLAFGARYSSLEFDDVKTNEAFGGKDGATENSLWKVSAKAKYKIYGASLIYAQTDEDGGYVAVDSSSKATLSAWNADINGIADADMIMANLNMQVLPTVNVGLNYNEVDAEDDDYDHAETYVQVKHQMSKNFSTYVRYGQWTEGENDDDSDVGRLQVEYTF